MTNDKDIIKKTSMRYWLVLIGIPVFAIVIVVKIFHIQYSAEGDELRKTSEEQRARKVVMPKRGDILDRNGNVLACSVPEYTVYFDTRIEHFKKNESLVPNNIDSIARGLAQIFAEDGHDYAYYYKKLNDAWANKKNIKLYEKNIDHTTLQKLKKLPLLRDGAYKGGFKVDVVNNRVYPYGGMGTRIIGSFSQGHGINGIEGSYDKYLYGDEKLIKSAVETGSNTDAGNGADIITTIDADIQTITHEELLKTLKRYNAEWGCAIVMDVKTGEVLSTSNLSKNDNPLDSNYYENFNYAVQGSCDPGSTIKLSALMAAFEDNYVQLDDVIDTGDGQVSYLNGQLVVTDWNHKTQGGFHKLTVREVFAQSSNVGISKIVEEHYLKTKREMHYVERIKSMGLGEPSGVDLQGERFPKVKDPSMTEGNERWSGTTLLQMSYGYEIELTPMQILTYYNAVANNGNVMQPHYVREIVKDGRSIKRFKPHKTRSSICSKETLKKAHDILNAVVEIGTAKRFASKYYKIAGKTGTAQTFEKGGYNKNKWRGSFCGYFPADDPKYSCIVVIQSHDSGDYNAVGAFRKIADRIFFMDEEMLKRTTPDVANNECAPTTANGNARDFKQIYSNLNIAHDSIASTDWVRTEIRSDKVHSSKINVDKKVVPNFYGMGMRDVLFLADSLEMRVQCCGVGKLFRQSMRAGSPYNGKNLIVLEFR